MEAGWVSVNVSASPEAVQALEAFKTSAQAVVDIVNTIVKMAKIVADLALKLYIDITDLEAAAMRAAIKGLRAILKDLTEDAGMYFLFVPMRIIDPLGWTGDPKFYYIGDSGSVGLPVAQTLPGPTYVSAPVGGQGGNYGFYAQVASSLSDELDIMRPTFGQDAYVGAVVFMAGADPANLSNLILLAKKLMRLFQLPGPDLVPQDMLPTPHGLRAEIVPVPMTGDVLLEQYTSGKDNFTTQPYAVRLDWEPDEKDWVLTAYGNVRYEIIGTFIYRWQAGAFKAADILAGTPTDVNWDSDDGKTVKVKRVDYDGFTSLFYDPTIVPGKVYEYGIAYDIVQLDDDGNNVAHPTISSAGAYVPLDVAAISVAIPTEIKLAPRHGVPPDWFSGKLFSMIPGLGRLVAKINAWLDRLEKSITTGKDELEKFVRFLEAEIDMYARWINEISLTLQQLIDALSFPSAYAGIWAMPVGKGGNDYFLSQLGSSLFNVDDPNCPPFQRGNEITCGFVMYMGSETPGARQRFIKTIDMLFGAFRDKTENAFLSAAASLGALDARLDRDIYLTQALVKTTCGEATVRLPTMGADLQPAAEYVTCSNQGLNAVTKSKFADPKDALTSDRKSR